MPTTVVPLALSPTARGWAKSVGTSAKDAQIINGLVVVSANPVMGTKSVYVSKRGGSTTSRTLASGVVNLKSYSSAFGNLLSATSSALYSNLTNIGTLTDNLPVRGNYVLANAVIADVDVVAFATEDGAGWFLFSDAIDNNFTTFTGNRTSGSPIISGIADTTGIYTGQLVTGTGIPADTRVLTVDSGTQITLNKNATSGAGTATTITKEAVAKIIDAQFPDDALSMVAMDGYFFAGSASLGICQSDINDPSSWGAGNRITPDFAGDRLSWICRIGNYVVSLGDSYSVQYFYNAGNASGSVLSSAEHLSVLGLQVVSVPVPAQDGYYCIAQPGSATPATGACGLYRVSGTNTFQRLSDDFWSGVISDNSLFQIGVIETNNHSLIACHSESAATFPVYNPSSNSFTFFSLSAALTSSYESRFTKSGESTDFLWADGNTWTDSDVAYTTTIQVEPQEMAGGNSTIDNQAILLADTEASGTASLDTSDDDYQNWVSKGTFDMTAARKEIWALGWHRGPRAYRIQHSANTGFRAQMLTIQHTPGSH